MPGEEPNIFSLVPLPSLFLGDQIRLKQILINIIKSALNFTVNGTISVLTAYDKTNKMLQVHVRGNGKAIKRADKTQLIRTLSSFKSSDKISNLEGVWMGLAICKKIVSNFGGRIDVYDDEGTTLTFSMRMDLPG